MSKTTYFSTDGARGAPHRGVFRRVDGDVLLLEKWTGDGWIDWPDLIAATGIGGDTIYVKITAAEADRLIAQVKRAAT